MGIMHRITAAIESFKGLEKRRSDLIDKPGFFNELKNAAIRSSGAINKRKGFHTISSNIPASGASLTNNELGIASYLPANELLVMNKNLKKVSEQSITITNNSSDSDVIASFLPTAEGKLEYGFRSRRTGIKVNIGTGDESAATPGNIVVQEDTLETSTVTFKIPAQEKYFKVEEYLNYGSGSIDGDEYMHWFRADANIFSSLDFRTGISVFFAGSIGNYTTSDRWNDFRIDFTDGSYIYTGAQDASSNSSEKHLVYNKGDGSGEKSFITSTGALARGQSGYVNNISDDYIKRFFTIGPSGYTLGVQSESTNQDLPLYTDSLTAVNGATWEDLNFQGKTISNIDVCKLEFGESNATAMIFDTLAFSIGEKSPATWTRTKYDSTGSLITGGTDGVVDACSVEYDTFFLFGRGNNDVIVDEFSQYNQVDGATFSFKSHGGIGGYGEESHVGLTMYGKYQGNISFGDGEYITAGEIFYPPLALSRPLFWQNRDAVVSYSGYGNAETSVQRNVSSAVNFQDITTTAITTPVTVSDLITTINNFTHVSLTSTASDATSAATVPAAYVIPVDKTIIGQGESLQLTYFKEDDITRGDTSYDYFDNLHTLFTSGSDEFQNVSHTILNSNIYFATGVDEICKYDGSKLYRAGLPIPTTPTAVADSTNLNPGDNLGIEENLHSDEHYYYLIVYKHEDNHGNVITSQQSVKVSAHLSHKGYINLTVPTLQSGGWDLDNVKILIYRAPRTTDDSVVDAASFYLVTDGSQPITTTASLPATSGSNLDGTTLNNNPINNDKNVATLIYTDYLQDSLINTNDFITTADYAEGRHDLPPKCKFITSHQGCLILAGTAESPSEVFYSLPEFNFITGEIGTEYFPNNANSVQMGGANGTSLTGMKTLRESLLIFNEKSVSVLSGDVTTTGVQYLKQDALTSQGEQGSLSSNSLQEWEGTLTFLSEEGILSTNTNLSYPTEMSEPIKPLLLNKKLDRKRAVSFFSSDQDVLGFFIPVKDTTISSGIFNSPINNKLFLYDVKINGWLEWGNIDMSGGVCRHKGKTYFLSRQGGRIALNLFKTASDRSSYSDFNQPITTSMITSWDSLGNSSVFKKYIRLKVFCTDSHQAFEGNSFKLNLYLRSNFDNTDIGPIELDPGVFGGWGIAEYGKFAWGSRDFKGIRTKLFGKSKAIALHFKNDTINENILMSGYAMEIAAPYKPEIKE